MVLDKTDNIGPFWLEETNSHPITLTQDSYLNILENGVLPCLESRRDISRLWFMQDGASSYCTNRFPRWLSGKFQDRIIGTSVWWRTQSPDLNPIDFYRWGIFGC